MLCGSQGRKRSHWSANDMLWGSQGRKRSHWLPALMASSRDRPMFSPIKPSQALPRNEMQRIFREKTLSCFAIHMLSLIARVSCLSVTAS